METKSFQKKDEAYAHVIAKAGDHVQTILGGVCSQMEDKCRPLIIQIYNATDAPMEYVDIQFDSGCMRKGSAHQIKSGAIEAFAVSNKDGSFCCGVSGEIYFQMANGDELGVGFSNPWNGGYKGHVKAVNGKFKRSNWQLYYAMENNHP